MPWEKSFDEEVAVEKAMAVFWEKGFASASVSDLLATTGLNKGSLYNAFGDKRKLFTRALLKYDNLQREGTISWLEGLNDPRQAIIAAFDWILEETLNDSGKKGCFIFNTAMELGTHDDEIHTIVTNSLDNIETFFRQCIEQAQDRGQIAADIDPIGTSKALLSMAISLRVLARGAYTPESLQAIVDQAKRIAGVAEQPITTPQAVVPTAA